MRAPGVGEPGRAAALGRDLGDGGAVGWTFGTAGPREPVRWRKLKVIEATVNVTAFGDKTRVRVSFQEKVLDNLGAVMEARAIDDEKFYQDFFAKVDKGIFLQKEKI